jgi:hypothetical protein
MNTRSLREESAFRHPSRMERKVLSVSAHGPDVRSLRALRPFGDVELHLLVRFEALGPFALDCTVVYVHVGAVLLDDETVALLGAEPLHDAGCRDDSPPCFAWLSCRYPTTQAAGLGPGPGSGLRLGGRGRHPLSCVSAPSTSIICRSVLPSPARISTRRGLASGATGIWIVSTPCS